MESIKLYGGKVEIFYSERTYREEKYQTFFDKDEGKITSVTGNMKCLDKPALKFWSANVGAEYFYLNWDPKKMKTKMDMIEMANGISKAHSNILKEKATRGKLIHTFAEEYFGGKKPAMPKDEKVMNGVAAFLKWANESDLVTVDMERVLYSRKFNVVGKADNTSKRKGKSLKHIVDYKTVSMYKRCRAWELEKWPDGLARDQFGNLIKYPVFLEPRIQVSAYRGMAMEEDKEDYGESYIMRFDQETGDFDVEIIPVEFQNEAWKMYGEHLTEVSKFISKYDIKPY